MGNLEKLFVSIQEGDLDHLKQLLESDRSLASSRDANGVSALMTAVYHRKAEMVKLLRKEVREIDIFEAAALGEADHLRRQLNEPGVVGTVSPDGFTPLHLAAFFGRPKIVELLLQAGADAEVVASNSSHVRPLHSATASRSHQVVWLLLEAGAHPNAVQHGGWTALHSAAKQGDIELVTLLLQHGADPHQAAESGETAVAMASSDAVRACLKSHGN